MLIDNNSYLKNRPVFGISYISYGYTRTNPSRRFTVNSRSKRNYVNIIFMLFFLIAENSLLTLLFTILLNPIYYMSMELCEILYKRRTVRKFQEKIVKEDKLRTVLEAGIQTPSSLNSQPWRFYVASGKNRNHIVKIVSKYPFYLADIVPYFPIFNDPEFMEHVKNFAKNLGGAPHVVVVTTPKVENDYVRKIQFIVCGAAIQNILLKASAEDLGVVCVTSAAFVEKEILDYLNIKNEEFVSLLAIGYSDEKPEPPPRNKGFIKFLE